MIVTQEKSKRVISSHDFDSVNCTIDAEDMRYVASLLRNNYSKPILAVIREISANGIDANLEANASRKVEITIPSRMTPHFNVRDFGGGLSQEDIFGLYSKYGKSTKRTSNDYIGAFGIGKFAPLSYGSNFTCISYHGGLKTSYNIFVNEDDDTRIVKLHEEPTNDPTGLSVEVAVADEDVDTFRKECKNFFRFFPDNDMPKFIGIGEDEQFFDEYEIVMESDDNDWFIIEDKVDYWDKNHNESCAIMGRVHYPINSSSVNWDSVIVEGDAKSQKESQHLRELASQSNLYIRFDIGSLKLHHSRESLEYNKSTQAEIIRVLKKVKGDVERIAKKKLGNAVDLWDAKVKYAQVVNALPHELKNLFQNSFEWDGTKIDNPTFNRDYKFQDEILITHYSKTDDSDATDGFKIVSRKESRIYADIDVQLVMNTAKSTYGNNLRARTLFNEDEKLKTIYGIQIANTAEAEESFYKDMGFNRVNADRFLDFSDIEKAKLQSKGRSVSGESRGDVPLFELISNNESYSKTNSSYWLNCTETIDDLEVACPADDLLVYVPIANYKVVDESGGTQDEVEDLGSLLRDYHAFKRQFDVVEGNEDGKDSKFPVLYGVRRKDCKRLSDGFWKNWSDFKLSFGKDFIKKNKKKLTDSEKVAVFRENQYELKHYSKIKEILNQTKMSEYWKELGGNHLINQVVDELKLMEDEQSDFEALYRMLMFVKKHDEKWVEKHFSTTYTLDDFDDKCKEIHKKYPLLRNIADEIYGWQDMRVSNFGKNIIGYVEIVDIAEKCENSS
jgi:hypothetical protein